MEKPKCTHALAFIQFQTWEIRVYAWKSPIALSECSSLCTPIARPPSHRSLLTLKQPSERSERGIIMHTILQTRKLKYRAACNCVQGHKSVHSRAEFYPRHPDSKILAPGHFIIQPVTICPQGVYNQRGTNNKKTDTTDTQVLQERNV